MTDPKKITELENAIAEKGKELDHARQEKKAATKEPERLVLAEKAERRISEQLRGLKAAMEAATYTPPAPSDVAELLQGLQKYRDEHAEKVERVNASILKAEAERREIEEGLHRAAVECDTALTIDLTDQRRDNTAKLDALREMKERVENLPVFPEGALKAEWAAICRKVTPDWNAAVLRLETLSAEYRSACRDYLQLYDSLKAARDQLSNCATKQNGRPMLFDPVLTVGLNSEKMILQKSDYIRIVSTIDPMFGIAL